MRKRTTSLSQEDAFVEGATTEAEATQTKTVDLHRYVQRHDWPLTSQTPEPSLASGRGDLKKPLLIHLSERLWKSIDRHTRVLGVSKGEWVRHAILRLMEEEQQTFFKMK